MSEGEYSAHGLTLTWDVSDNFTIKSLTGYRELDSDIHQDYASAFSTPGNPFPTDFITFDTLDTDQFTQELQFLGSFGERFEYLVGLYYFNEKGDHFQHIDINLATLPPAFGGPIFHRQGPRHRCGVDFGSGVRTSHLDTGDPGRPAGA